MMIDKSPHEIEALVIARKRFTEIVLEIGFNLEKYTSEQIETLIESTVDGYHETGPCL
jgi:hypothetical protein